MTEQGGMGPRGKEDEVEGHKRQKRELFMNN